MGSRVTNTPRKMVPTLGSSDAAWTQECGYRAHSADQQGHFGRISFTSTPFVRKSLSWISFVMRNASILKTRNTFCQFLYKIYFANI